jgi:hypothetical protein
MSDDAKKKRYPWGCLIILTVFLLVAYPLSFGPFVWLLFNGYISGPMEIALYRFYAPLIELLWNDTVYPPWLCELLNDYCGLFTDNL